MGQESVWLVPTLDRLRSNLVCEDTWYSFLMPDSMLQRTMDCEGQAASTDDNDDKKDGVNDDLPTPGQGIVVGD